ncbi:RNA polymerase I specific transcription initiation factor RRN9 [Penicillium cf. griseofulvum]|nr:RNA polymerase I specific transcription initiation factor RRN9 [Penicillium cf. griseofulvum]
MSSLYGSQVPWPELLPPQSAQPRQSLFGGPSSDVGLQPSSQPEPPRRSLFGGPIKQNDNLEPLSEADHMDEALDQGESEFDTIMREQPLAFEDDSDDESYEEDNRGRSRIRSKRAQESQRDPIYYVVDRGLDLRPGVERPNLYDGHATSWKNYNADDIGAYNAMDIHRARDLAAHLYNAHAIRRRARETARNNPGVVNKAPLRVSKRWAAWPVHATTVPRANEIIRREMDVPNTFQMQPDLRPSAELEDCLTALILKASKEAFQARELNFEEIEDNPEYKMNDGDELMDDELGKKEEEEGEGEGEEEEPLDTRILEPTVLLGEEESLRQLRPMVRNVISHVDRLLYGLHCAMKGRKYDEDSGDEQWTVSDEEDYQTRETRKRGSRSRSRGRSSARQESQQRETPRRSNSARAYYTGPETEDESLRDVSQTRAQSSNSPTGDGNHPTKRRLKLRDWSEVMGLASMMGLPTPAVMRASKRCADLFGEDMEFRILPEGRVRKKRKANDREEYAYTESESDSDSAPPSPQLPPRPARKRITKTKPEVEPKPKATATAKIPGQRRSKSYISPAIIPPSSSPSPSPPPPPEVPPEPIEPIIESTDQVADQEPKTVKKVVGKGPHRKADIICPIKSCSRHNKGFSRKWNLNQHLKKAHGIHVAAGNEALIERDDQNIMLE